MHAAHPHALRPLALALVAAALIALALALAPRVGTLDLGGRSAQPAPPATDPIAQQAPARPAWVDGPLAGMQRVAAFPGR